MPRPPPPSTSMLDQVAAAIATADSARFENDPARYRKLALAALKPLGCPYLMTAARRSGFPVKYGHIGRRDNKSLDKIGAGRPPHNVAFRPRQPLASFPGSNGSQDQL